MGTARFLVATIAAVIVLLVFGFISYALIFAGFFAENAGSSAGLMKTEPDMLFIYLGELCFAILLTSTIGCWAGVSGAGPGFRIGALLGLLFGLYVGLLFYGTANFMSLQATLLDIGLTTVRTALAGAVVGIVLARK